MAKAKLLEDKNPESIPPSPFQCPIYDDGKYALYKEWWNLHRPVIIKPPIQPRLRQMVHFEPNSSLDHAFLLQLDQLSPALRRNLESRQTDHSL